MSSRTTTSPMPRSTMSSSASRTSLSSVKIGDGSFSPGDVIVESLLPRLRSLASSLSSNAKRGLPAVPSQGGMYVDPSQDEDDGDQALPLRDHPAVRRAQQECTTLQNGNSVTIVEDEDVKEEVVQLTGRDAELVFPCRNVFQYVVLFLKDMEHFVEIQVDVLDDTQRYRQLRTTNARSLAKVDADTCQLPMVMGQEPGWRYMCLDLHELTRRAFGAKHVTTLQLRITGHCRVLRVYFQDEQYSDTELPSYLTFLG